MTEASNAALYAALVRAQSAAKSVDKDGRNQFHRYDYTTTEAMIDAAKACLSAHGLCVLPVTAEVVASELRRTWRVAHESGCYVDVAQTPWPVVAEKGRPIDKATASADTTSLGYFLRCLLQIPRGLGDDHMDHDSRAAPPSTPPPTQRRDPQPTPPPTQRRDPQPTPRVVEQPAKRKSASAVVADHARRVIACATHDELDAACEALTERAALPESARTAIELVETRQWALVEGVPWDATQSEREIVDRVIGPIEGGR